MTQLAALAYVNRSFPFSEGWNSPRDPKDGLLVDLFAGGGGFSLGTSQAFGRPIDIAINHNPIAISVHTANHPEAKHYLCDIYEVDPLEATQGLPIRCLSASPDCTHHSQSKAGQPRDKKVRALSWILHRWAGKARPDIIVMENVRQIKNWGPLVAKRDPETGRALKRAGKKWVVAEPGERVPVGEQYLIPDKRRQGKSWKKLLRGFQQMGYDVDCRVLRASLYGVPTSRERLFLIARCDGEAIRWPKPTHGEDGLLAARTAGECIDWELPSKSIFVGAERKKALATATLGRVRKGFIKHVLGEKRPFIMPMTHQGGHRSHGLTEPLPTITCAHRGELAVCEPVIVTCSHGEYGKDGRKRWGDGARSSRDPMPTVTSRRDYGVAQACLVQYYSDKSERDNRAKGLHEPLPTQSTENRFGLAEAVWSPDEPAAKHDLMTAFLSYAYTSNSNGGEGALDRPMNVITAGGLHHGLVEGVLAPEMREGAERVAEFLYGDEARGKDGKFMPIIMVVDGRRWVLVDIKLRMLEPKELFSAQGFTPDYRYAVGASGEAITKTDQVKLCGNSVCPPLARAVIEANIGLRPDAEVGVPMKMAA